MTIQNGHIDSMFSFAFDHGFPDVFFICPGQLRKGTDTGNFGLGRISNWGASGRLGCPWLICCFTLKPSLKTINIIRIEFTFGGRLLLPCPKNLSTSFWVGIYDCGLGFLFGPLRLERPPFCPSDILFNEPPPPPHLKNLNKDLLGPF